MPPACLRTSDKGAVTKLHFPLAASSKNSSKFFHLLGMEAGAVTRFHAALASWRTSLSP